MEETKVLSSPSSQDYRSDTEYLHGKAFIIKQPKYKHLNTKENAIVSVDVNHSNYNIDLYCFNSFPVLFCNPKYLNTLFSSSTSKTLWSRIETKHLKSHTSICKACDLPRATKITYGQACTV